jgi:hypothetical protein
MGVADPFLCHGTAGLAQIMKAVYQVSGDVRFKEKALDMVRRTTAACERANGEPYDFWDETYAEEIATSRFGFLLGATGTALALLSAISSRPPKWDAPLLIGIHP